MPIETKKPYCVESHVSFFSNDSVQVEFYINGLLSGSTKSGYYSGHDFIAGVIPTHYMLRTKAVIPDSKFYELIEQCSLMVALDNFSVSKKRPYTSPLKPVFCQSVVNFRNKHELSCSPFKSDYQNETQTESWWRVFSKSDRIFPVFDDIDNDPAFFHEKTIPFPLDRGVYSWQVKFRNNFDQWGQWSEPCTIKVKEQRLSKVILENVYISKTIGGKAVSRVSRDSWYYVNVSVSKRISWDSCGYLLVFLHDSSYTFGNIANKGGKFIPSSSYIMNLSLANKKFVLFEKIKENSILSNPVSDSLPSLYMDGRKGGWVVDTVNNRMSVKFRLLPQANPGTWHLSCGLVYIDGLDSMLNTVEKNSNLAGFSFQVSESPKTKNLRKILFFVLTSLFVLVLLFFRIRKKKTRQVLLEQQKDSIFRKYIETHLEDKISVQDVIQNLHLNKQSFHQLLKDNGIGLFPEYVNSIKIEKAREFLISTNRNISEISFSLGYENTNYFIRIFRKAEHCTPKEYRIKFHENSEKIV